MKTIRHDRDFIYFKYFWLLVLLPKSAQFFALVLIYMMISDTGIKWRLHSDIVYCILGTAVQYCAILLSLLRNEFDLMRTLAALNTATMWLVASSYFSLFSIRQYSERDMRRLMSYVIFNFSVFSILYLIFLSGREISFSTFGHQYSLQYVDYLTSGSTSRFRALMESKLSPSHFFISQLPLLALALVRSRHKELLLLVAVIAYAGNIGSHSRIGIIMSTLAIIGYCMIYFSYRVTLITSKRGWLSLLLTGFLMFLASLMSYYRKILSAVMRLYNWRPGSNRARIMLYENTIKRVLLESPLIGIGIKYTDPQTHLPYGSHSTYIGLFFKAGIVGAILYLIGFSQILTGIFSLYKNSSQKYPIYIMVLAYFGFLIFADIDSLDWGIVGVFSTWGILMNSCNTTILENREKEKNVIRGGVLREDRDFIQNPYYGIRNVKFQYSGLISLETILLFVLFLCMHSLPFSPKFSQGAMNCIILCASSAIHSIAYNKPLTKHDMLCFVLAAEVALYSINTEGVRYALTIALITFWKKARFRNLLPYCETLALYGSAICFMQAFIRVERTYGFSSSATQMSCFLLTLEIYILVCMNNGEKNAFSTLSVVCCVIALYLTETRSTFLIGLAALLFRLLVNVIHFLKKMRSLFVPFIVAILALLLLYLIYDNQIISYLFAQMARTNQSASSATRFHLYRLLAAQIFSTPRAVLIGRRGGYVETFFGHLMKVDTYFPAHQDYILFLCEYGIVGLTLLYLAFFRGNKSLLYLLIVYSTCSFHNAVLNAPLIALITITAEDLGAKGYHLVL